MSKIKDIKEWKELFETHILTRGYYYAQEDRVWDIGHEKDVVSAVVAGTEDYLVSILYTELQVSFLFRSQLRSSLQACAT